MNNYGYPTTRRFHRTMVDAFQQDQAEWWFPPKRSTMDTVLITLGVMMWIGIGIYFWGAT